MIIGSDNTRGRDKPKLILDGIVKQDMIGLSIGEHLALERAE